MLRKLCASVTLCALVTLYAFSLASAPLDKRALLEYALPSAAVYYQKQPKPWFMDCAVSAACTVHFEVYTDAEMTGRAASVRKKLSNSGMFRITWSGKSGNNRLLPGAYWCRAYASGEDDLAHVFRIEIREGMPPDTELAPNGAMLPSSLDDASVWAAMMKPIVVVDIGATKHQRIYSEPDGGSEPVGSVHGQSQGLEIIEAGARYTRVRAWRHEDGEPVEGYIPTKKLKTVTPSAHYGLVIDKAAQRMTVYEHGRPIGRLRVSTGLMTGGKLFRETRAGAFITTDRVAPFESKGFRYEYAIRIDGGNLIHQVGYSTEDGSFDEQLSRLGQKASEGCVRVDSREGGMNARWLWTNLEYGTKVLVLDDPAVRAARLRQLNGSI